MPSVDVDAEDESHCFSITTWTSWERVSGQDGQKCSADDPDFVCKTASVQTADRIGTAFVAAHKQIFTKLTLPKAVRASYEPPAGLAMFRAVQKEEKKEAAKKQRADAKRAEKAKEVKKAEDAAQKAEEKLNARKLELAAERQRAAEKELAAAEKESSVPPLIALLLCALEVQEMQKYRNDKLYEISDR